MTAPSDPQLRVNLEQLLSTAVNWKQSAAGMLGGAPPPVTTPGWPSGLVTAGIHAGAAQATTQMQAGMVDTAENVTTAGNAMQRMDQAGGMKLADITGPVSDVIGSATGTGGALSGILGSFTGAITGVLSTALRQQGQQQNPNNYGGDTYGHSDIASSGSL